MPSDTTLGLAADFPGGAALAGQALHRTPCGRAAPLLAVPAPLAWPGRVGKSHAVCRPGREGQQHPPDEVERNVNGSEHSRESVPFAVLVHCWLPDSAAFKWR